MFSAALIQATSGLFLAWVVLCTFFDPLQEIYSPRIDSAHLRIMALCKKLGIEDIDAEVEKYLEEFENTANKSEPDQS